MQNPSHREVYTTSLSRNLRKSCSKKVKVFDYKFGLNISTFSNQFFVIFWDGGSTSKRTKTNLPNNKFELIIPK
jgi:carbohydrate-binding DOMON domain-containing protein